MNATAAFVLVFGLIAVFAVEMWADHHTKLPFWAILVSGAVACIVLGQIVSNLL